MELAEIKRALADRAEEVCAFLLPGGKVDGKDWVCGDLAGGEGKSFKVLLRGDKAGIFKDFAGDIGGSNLLELWIQVKGVPFVEALEAARAWLGEHGVRETKNVKPAAKRTYAKPIIKGITRIMDPATFYLTTERRIPVDVVEQYKVAITTDGGAIVFPYLNHAAPHDAQMIKWLALERDADGKKKVWCSKDTPKVLYGKHTRRPNERWLLISEGEIDAKSWASQRIQGLCCTSVPFGAKWEGKDGKDPNDEWIENDWEFLHSFERIYLSMDMDEEGRKACASIIKRLGREICFVITLPTKDANELLQAGRDAELVFAFNAAKTLDPDALKNASHFRESVLDRMFATDQEARRGIPLPFGKYPFHLRWNEWTAVTGQNGSGKSQLLGYLLVHLWKLGHPACVASLEVPVGQTLVYYVNQATGTKHPTRAKAEEALTWLAGGFWFYDKVGEANWKDVLAAFRYAYRRYGVKFFVIDSWMKMGISSEDFEMQGVVCNAISDFCSECDVHVFVVAHPRKSKDELQVVNKMDVKGSGELTDQAHNVWIVWRNKGKEREIEKMIKAKDDDAKITAKRRLKPDTQLIVAKQRNDDGDEPTIDLWMVKEAKQFFGWHRVEGHSFLTEPKPPELPIDVPTPNEGQIDEDVPF